MALLDALYADDDLFEDLLGALLNYRRVQFAHGKPVDRIDYLLEVLDPEPAPRPRPALPGSIPLPAEV